MRFLETCVQGGRTTESVRQRTIETSIASASTAVNYRFLNVAVVALVSSFSQLFGDPLWSVAEINQMSASP